MPLKLTNTNAAYNGHTAGTQCLSRTSGQDAPTAGTQCLPRLRRSLRKQTARSLLSAPSGKALQKQSKNLHKGNHRSPTTCEKWKNKITEGPNPGNSPGVGASLLRGKLPSLFVFYFRLANGYRAMDAQRPSTKALSQWSPCNVSQRSGPAGSCKRPCSGPAYRWHRLCNSSRCRSSPRTAS